MGHLRTVAVLSAIAFVVYDFTNDADRDASGNIIGEGQIDAFAMRIGDCFDDSEEMLNSDEEVEVFDLAGLPCSKPHDNEVYAVFDVSLATFPGDGAMFDVATNECLSHFKSFVGKSYDDSLLEIFPMYPTRESWLQKSDREVVCALYHLEGEKLTGSVEDSAI